MFYLQKRNHSFFLRDTLQLIPQIQRKSVHVRYRLLYFSITDGGCDLCQAVSPLLLQKMSGCWLSSAKTIEHA